MPAVINNPTASKAFRVGGPARPRLRRGHPQAAGLVAAWKWPECAGRCSVTGLELRPVGAVGTDGALGMVSNTAAISAYQATALPSMLSTGSLTVVFQGTQLTTVSGQDARIFGLSYNNPISNPYTLALLGIDPSANKYKYMYNSSGSYQQTTGAAVLSAGSDLWLAGYTSLSAGNSVGSIIVGDNGVQNGASSNLPAVGSSPAVGFGSMQLGTGDGTNSGIAGEYGLIYTRLLGANELKWLRTRGRDLWARVRDRAGYTAAIAAGASAAALFGSGGAMLGGSSAWSLGLAGTAAGGSRLAGSAGLSLSLSGQAAGGTRLAGTTAAPGVIWTPPGSGGPELGGSGIAGTNTTATASGGARLSGAAPGVTLAVATAAGGALLAGSTGVPSVAIAAAGSGGALLAGGPAPLARFTPAPSGGALLAGQAGPLLGTTAVAAGGLVLGGQIDPPTPVVIVEWAAPWMQGFERTDPSDWLDMAPAIEVVSSSDPCATAPGIERPGPSDPINPAPTGGPAPGFEVFP